METARYTIPELVADLRQITAQAKNEHEILKRVRPLARRAALSREAWLEDRMYEANPEKKTETQFILKMAD